MKRRRLARSLDDDESLLGNPDNENNLTMTVNSADVSSSASSPFKDFNITQRRRSGNVLGSLWPSNSPLLEGQNGVATPSSSANKALFLATPPSPFKLSTPVKNTPASQRRRSSRHGAAGLSPGGGGSYLNPPLSPLVLSSLWSNTPVPPVTSSTVSSAAALLQKSPSPPKHGSALSCPVETASNRSGH